MTNPVAQETWRAEMDGTVVRVAVADEVALVGCGTKVIALDAGSGGELWRRDTGTPGPFRVAEGTVYATGGGHVRALDVRTGDERWRFKGAIPVRPAAAGGRVCVIGGSPRWGRTLHVLSARTGREKWRMEADPKLSAPAGTADLIFVGCADGALLALKARNGRERWRVEPDRWHPDWPERGGGIEILDVADGRVYLAGLAYQPPPLGFVAAVEAGSGRAIWQTIAGYDPGEGLPDAGDPPAAAVPGGVCVGEPGQLTYLAAETGQARIYSFGAEARCSPPVVIGGLVCVGIGERWIQAFDAATGRPEWSIEDGLRPSTGPVPVAVSRGRLVVGGHRCVFLVDVRTGMAL